MKKNNIGELLKEFKDLQNKTNEMFDKYENVIIRGHRNNCIIKNAYNSYKNRMWEILRIVDDIGVLELFMKELEEVEEKEEEKICENIDNSIVQAATKENKINDLLVEKANKLIESIEIEPNRSAAVYLDYAKEKGIKTSDKNSMGRKILQCHLMKYGISNIWYKAAEKHNVNTKEELYNVYFNQLVDMLRAEKEVKTPLKMDLQALASNKKELKPIFNNDIKGHEEYQREQLKIYNSNTLKFTHKRINNKMIDEYTKYFIYKDNTFMSVKPGKDYPSGYYEHVRKYNYKVDHVNKVILFTDKEIEEVEPIKEEFYNNNEVEPAAEQIEDNYFYSDINLNNILKHVEEVKQFNNSKSIEYFGNYATPQRGSFRIEKNNNNFYIKAMIETKENYFEKLEIFEEPEKAIDLYINFLSKYQLDYIKSVS